MMDKLKKGYDGPNLYIVVTRTEKSGSPSEYRWHVTMRAADSTGERKLGYRASGRIDGLGNSIFEGGPEVHDEERPVWTTMNATDRPDIRKRIRELVLSATAKMKDSGQDKFEHLIK